MNVSVAMCTYNGELYLQEQLHSLASQDCPPHELVICDDCSNDRTVEIVKHFAKTSSFPVRFFQNKNNLGSTANFDQAISLCSGELIALCDQDDVWEPTKIKKQVRAFLEDPGTGGVFSDGELIGATSQPLRHSLWDSLEFTPSMRKRALSSGFAMVLAQQNFVTGATLMFRTELRTCFSPIPKEWVHDAWITWMICLHSRLKMLPDRLIRYRIHRNQQIGANLQSLQERLGKGKWEAVLQHELELARMRLLLEKFKNSSHVDAVNYANLIQGKINFLSARITLLRKSVGLRLAGLLLEIKDYRRFSKGFRSIAGDLLR